MSTEETKFGSGWISGTLSVALSLVGLLAVACFHYPTLLTIPEARPAYPIALVRLVLHCVLVSAFALGFISVMLRKNVTLGITGMSVVLIAALLGGSRVAVQGGIQSDYYLGVDYALLLLITYSLIFIPLEKLFGRINQGVFRRGWQIDLTYFFVSTMLVQLTTYLTLRPASAFFSWAVSADLQGLVRTQPYLLQFIEIVIMADFLQYWIHRAFHSIPQLWRFHAIHHSASVMDWIAGNRLHLVDLAVTRSLIYLPAFLLGFDETPMFLYIVFVAVYSVFIHANLKFSFGKWSYLFVTPRFHHWHHGIEKEAIDKNFAIHFPFWDLIFGTFYLPNDRWPQGYGIHNSDVPESYLLQWSYPFLRRKSKRS